MFLISYCLQCVVTIHLCVVRVSTYSTYIIILCCWLSLPTVNNEHPFRDDSQLYYRFKDHKSVPHESRPTKRWSFFTRGFRRQASEEDITNGRPVSFTSITSSPRSSRSSLTSILDECFDTIAALGPETIIYATLRKP